MLTPCDQVGKFSANKVEVNSSTLYQMNTLESSGLIPFTDSEVTVSLGGTEPGIEDPSPPYRKVEVSKDSLLRHQSSILNHI